MPVAMVFADHRHIDDPPRITRDNVTKALICPLDRHMLRWNDDFWCPFHTDQRRIGTPAATEGDLSG